MSLVRVVSNEELNKQEAEKNKPQELFIDNLAAFLRKQWESARNHKSVVQDRMSKAQRQRAGEYDSDKLAMIRKQGGAEVYMQITAVKCRAAESWIRDVLINAGDKPWTIAPTPVPDLPQEVRQAIEMRVMEEMKAFLYATGGATPENPLSMAKSRLEDLSEELKVDAVEEAKKSAEGMEQQIYDQMLEGNWREAFNSIVYDIVTFPACFIKGPVLRKKKAMKWGQSQDKWAYSVSEEVALEFERVSPFDIYPSVDSTSVDDGDLFERHKMTRNDLAELIGVHGYKEAEIRAVLQEFGAGGLQSWIEGDGDRKVLEDDNAAYSSTIEALEFWGSVQGSLLKEWGLEGELDEDLDYQVNAWVIGNHVIRAVLNPDPLGRKPYHKSSYEEIPDAFWGRAVPELMEDLQGVCNATARALVNNMGIASGPQVEVNVDRVPQGEDITDIYPWKIWQTSNDLVGGGSPAVRFNQPAAIIEPLLGVYEKFSRLADDYTGIPAYTYGNSSVGGAGRTASGLSMLMSSASKGIKQVISNIDNGLIEPAVERLYVHNMRYSEDNSIKGDAKVVARGSISLIQKEQLMVRRTEFLQSTANPIDAQIVGPDGRAAILREVAKTLDMPVDDIIPSKERLEQINQMQMAQQQQEAQALDEAGNPINGADNAQFNRLPQ